MLEYPLSVLELLVYVLAAITLLVGVFSRRRHIIIWAFSIVLLNILFYAKAYLVSSYISLMLMLLGITSISMMIFAGLLTYIIDNRLVEK